MKTSIILVAVCVIGCGGVAPELETQVCEGPGVSGLSVSEGSDCCLRPGNWEGVGLVPVDVQSAYGVAEAVGFGGKCGVFVKEERELIADGDCVRTTVSRYEFQEDFVSLVIKHQNYCKGVGVTVKGVSHDYAYRVVK